MSAKDRPSDQPEILSLSKVWTGGYFFVIHGLKNKKNDASNIVQCGTTLANHV